MRNHSRKGTEFFKISKKHMAGGGKKKKIDTNLKEFDIVWIGGINSANMIKYFQHKHFHGTMAGFNPNSKFYYQHLYEYIISGNMKPYKFSAMPFSSNYDILESKCGRDAITQIIPEKNQIISDKGETYTYKTLVLNTGLDQKAHCMPFLKNLVSDDFAKSRVFIQDTTSITNVIRNSRIFFMHKDGDFILYLPKLPSRRESYDHWYLALDSYLSRGVLNEAHNRGMKIRVITPEKNLFKFPFANEIVNEEISQRTMIEVHYGMELVNVEIKECDHGTRRYAYFKDLKTGSEVTLDFGTLLVTPEHKTRELYKNSDLGLVTVNPYTLQHTKYQNIFSFGDCNNTPTTKGMYASLNQSVVLRNNVWDYVHGNELKAIYEGYSAFQVHHSIDRVWIFKHYYNYVPTAFNFYVPRFLGFIVFKLKNAFEKQYFQKIWQKKPNFSYPYLQKDRYFRPLEENRFLKKNNISLKQVFIHKNQKPILSFEKEGHGYGHGHADNHLAVAH